MLCHLQISVQRFFVIFSAYTYFTKSYYQEIERAYWKVENVSNIVRSHAELVLATHCSSMLHKMLLYYQLEFPDHYIGYFDDNWECKFTIITLYDGYIMYIKGAAPKT